MNTTDDEQTALERTSGHPLTGVALTTISVLIPTPLTALLPVLADSLATGRHKRRIDEELKRINTVLEAQRHKVNCLTDPQYKLLNEVIIAVLHNLENEKAENLRKAIANTLSASNVTYTVANQVSRVLRDISAAELQFVINSAAFNSIMLGPINGEVSSDVLIVNKGSPDAALVASLIGLGVLVPEGSSLDRLGRYVFASFASELVLLVTDKSSLSNHV